MLAPLADQAHTTADYVRERDTGSDFVEKLRRKGHLATVTQRLAVRDC